MDHPMNRIVEQMLESYAQCGGIKHLDGAKLPSKMAVAALTQELLHELALQLGSLQKKLKREIAKSLAMHPVPGRDAEGITLDFLGKLHQVRSLIQTDVEAAYQGDPAATNHEEIILAYPGIEAITIQRLA